MSLGIQWQWAQPVEFSNLSVNAERNKNFLTNLGENLGTAAAGIQGWIKDNEAVKIMSGEDIKEAEAELAKLKARLPEIDKEIAEVKQEMANVAGNSGSAGMEDYKPNTNMEGYVSYMGDPAKQIESYGQATEEYNAERNKSNTLGMRTGGYR